MPAQPHKPTLTGVASRLELINKRETVITGRLITIRTEESRLEAERRNIREERDRLKATFTDHIYP